MITLKEKIKVNTAVLSSDQPFYLESGEKLDGIEIAYTTYGELNADKSNVVWICHALTANANPSEWWPGLVGDHDLINPKDYFIVCANILGSCYGSTGPQSKKYLNETNSHSNFPFITVRDMVNAHILLANHLKIDSIYLLMGGSLGGQQAIEWSITEASRIKNLFLIATNAYHSPYGIAFNESQRLALLADSTYFTNKDDAAQNGLKAARAIALISYRTYEAYNATQRESDLNKAHTFPAAGYQQYQGDKLVKRFNAYSYYTLSRAMDSHQVGRNRNSVQGALNSITAKTLCVGISSDILFPPEEQKFLKDNIPNARYKEIDSFFGHDGFLIEVEKITKLLNSFLQS